MAGIGREIIHKVLPSPNPSNFFMVNSLTGFIIYYYLFKLLPLIKKSIKKIPEGFFYMVAGARFELATFGLRGQRISLSSIAMTRLGF